MDNLQIKKTKSSMEVDFSKDTGILELSGSSYPENTIDFFGPINEWIRNYIATYKKEITINFRLSYLNTSSTKCLLDIFETMDEYYKEGGKVKINWYYAEDDEDIMETGEELAEDFEYPIELIPY